MPELPDILLYLHALHPRIVGQRVERVRLASPFLLRSIDPPLSAIEGREIVDLHRLGKRIAMEAEGELFLVFHLMIAGRFRWKERGAKIPGKVGLLALDFASGTLVMTEAGTKRQASLHVVQGRTALAQHNPGGLEVLDASLADFAAALRKENHTLKRAMTDPHVLSGIGNAYSDEILHAARLSPFKQTQSLTDDELVRLFDATRATLLEWTRRLQDEAGEGFPEKVTAFRPGMAVHGRYREPCPVCGTAVQRIVWAENVSRSASSTSRPPGSSARSASRPVSTCSDARRVEPASVRISVPCSKSSASRPTRPGTAVPGPFQRNRPAIIRWITRYASPSSAKTTRLPIRSRRTTRRPSAADIGVPTDRRRNGAARRTRSIRRPTTRGPSAWMYRRMSGNSGKRTCTPAELDHVRRVNRGRRPSPQRWNVAAAPKLRAPVLSSMARTTTW